VHNAGSPRSQLPEVCIRCRVECQERDFEDNNKGSKTRTLLARVCVTKRHDRPAGNTTRCGALFSFSKHDKFNIKRAGNRFGSEKKK
jgi:hypothetical protein